MKQLIADEKFTNIQRAQAGLTKLFSEAKRTTSFFRVMKNDTPLGVLVPQNVWDDFLEDLEALSSPAYLARIQRSRSQKKRYTGAELKRELGL